MPAGLVKIALLEERKQLGGCWGGGGGGGVGGGSGLGSSFSQEPSGRAEFIAPAHWRHSWNMACQKVLLSTVFCL